jgi:hypothetical protein
MARQRLLKPEFFHDEVLASCAPHARLLFEGLWVLADREGRLREQPAVIHGAIFPYEPDLKVGSMLDDLHSRNFLIRYEVEGRRYIQVRNFLKHQKPHIKEAQSVIPPPEKGREITGPSPVISRLSRPESVTESVPDTESESVVAAPPVLALTSPPSSRQSKPHGPASWTREACDDWITAYRGTAPGGRIGKALKPLVDEHGWAAVRESWRAYLAQVDAQYASPQDFAAKYGRWSGAVVAAPRNGKPSVQDRTAANLQAWIESKEREQ